MKSVWCRPEALLPVGMDIVPYYQNLPGGLAGDGYHGVRDDDCVSLD